MGGDVVKIAKSGKIVVGPGGFSRLCEFRRHPNPRSGSISDCWQKITEFSRILREFPIFPNMVRGGCTVCGGRGQVGLYFYGTEALVLCALGTEHLPKCPHIIVHLALGILLK